MKDQPLVSVVCTAYNHQDYIKETLEGFIVQQTNFPIEVIVHDDASTDNTASIMREYEVKYPHLFRNIYQKENQYSKKVNIWENLFVNYCRGKYIAICEGDDYWTEPLKLQKQVDFLEEHQEYSMTYARVRYYQQSTGQFISVFGCDFNGLKGLLRGNVIPTLSVCFRRHLYIDYSQSIAFDAERWKMADYPLWLYLSAKGDINFQKDIVGVYRILSESVSHSTNIENEIQFVKSYADIKRYYVNRFHVCDKRIIDNIEEQQIVGIFRALIKRRMPLNTMKSLIESCPAATFKIMILKGALYSNFICKILTSFWKRK